MTKYKDRKRLGKPRKKLKEKIKAENKKKEKVLLDEEKYIKEQRNESLSTQGNSLEHKKEKEKPEFLLLFSFFRGWMETQFNGILKNKGSGPISFIKSPVWDEREFQRETQSSILNFTLKISIKQVGMSKMESTIFKKGKVNLKLISISN
jgi:hypothetical protein